jgi:hypothetical protein
MVLRCLDMDIVKRNALVMGGRIGAEDGERVRGTT